jgi:hypothetical protein
MPPSKPKTWKSITFTCPGVCKGDPKWRGDLGLPCTVCGGVGKLTVYNGAEVEADNWDKLMAGLRERGERRQARARVRAGRVLDDLGVGHIDEDVA